MRSHLSVVFLLLAVPLSTALPPPSYGKCLEIENDSAHDIEAIVMFKNGNHESKKIDTGKTGKFEDFIKDGKTTYVNPVTSFTVKYEDSTRGVTENTHIEMYTKGIQDCLKRIISDVPHIQHNDY